MEYDQFETQILRELSARMDGNIRLARRDIQVINDTKKGIAVLIPDTSVVSMLYLDEAYEQYMSGISVEEIADCLDKEILLTRQALPEMPRLTQDFVREQVYCSVINARENTALLEKSPHETLEDLAVVARIRVSDTGSLLVTRGLLQQVQMTQAELFESAHKNTDTRGFECWPIGALIQSILTSEELPEEYTEDVRSAAVGMYVVTNAERYEGAAAIVSPRALEEAHNIIKEDYFILPSSRHELILLPKSTPVQLEEMERIVRDINMNVVHKGDKLSDQVYQYDSHTRKVLQAIDGNKAFKDILGEKEIKNHGRGR